MPALLHDWLFAVPIVRLFVIIAAGYLLGEIRFPGGFRLGVAGVLFVGLACGALSPSLDLPGEFQTLGLVLFVYCIGLQAAPGFLKSFRRDGLQLNAAVLVALLVVVGLVALCARWSGRPASLIAGTFCGALTTTPGLGAVTEALVRNGGPAGEVDLAVVGYGVSYPIALLVVLVLTEILVRRFPTTGATPATTPPGPASLTIQVERLAADGVSWLAAELEEKAGVLLTHRRLPGGAVEPVTPTTPLTLGCSVVAVGSVEGLRSATGLLGHLSAASVPADLAQFEVHRYFVSNRAATGRPVAELDLGRLGAAIVKLRRGDVDLPVTPATKLEVGDRVRVISLREKEAAVRAFFGNSLTVLTETGYFSIALGIILGLLLGQIPVPVPGLSQPVKLGLAGGPLVVALWLGARGRTGPFVWTIPNEVNLTLRQLGILLFLAAVGVKAGQSLPEHLRHFGLGMIAWSTAFVVAAHLTLLACLLALRQRDQPVLLGTMAALQTQPALLSFAATRTDSGPLNTAYATAYPLAVVLKIIFAQLILAL